MASDDETEEESIFRKSSSSDDYSNDDDDESIRAQSSPYDWISNLVPFGHPSSRHILSVTADVKKRRFRRYIDSKRKSVQNFESVTTFRLLNVTETIYYATLNHTNPRLIQLFKQDFVQKCDLGKEKKSFSCYPHYNTIANSSKLSSFFGGGRTLTSFWFIFNLFPVFTFLCQIIMSVKFLKELILFD